MRITDSSVVMNAGHSSLVYNETREKLRTWVGPQRSQDHNRHDQIHLSPGSQALMQKLKSSSDAGLETDGSSLEASLKKLIVEILSGRKSQTMDASELQPDQTDAAPQPAAETQASSAPQGAGWGMEYSREETHVEREQMSFSATGVVHTADNKEITFSLNLEMSREYISQSRIEIRAGEALVDPLVINYAGDAAQLAGKTFSFDLNAGGIAENMPELTAGHGYLALDKDGDGLITSGAELFGPSSGDGFSELAAYDSDGNAWIDEADPVFSQLSLMRVQDGQAALSTLKDQGVGAIYVGSLSSPFDLRDSNNELQAQISRTGIFLNEDGSVGTVQHLDVVV